MPVTRSGQCMDSTLAPEKSPDHSPPSGQCTEGNGGDRAGNLTSTSDIVEAIIQALSDQKVLNKLIPAITQALHEGFIMELEKRDKTIEKLQKEMDQTQAKFEELEQYSRRNCLVVHGAAEKPGENTNAIICDIAKEKFKQDIVMTDIDRSHRIGQRGKSDRNGRPKTRPIIVKFSRYDQRALFYARRKELKGTNIYVHENLTGERQGWLNEARKSYPAPTNKVWSQDGKIKIRTQNNRLLTIVCKADLKKLNIR